MLTSNIARLPQILKGDGFKTAAFSTMGNVASDIGFDVGFDQYYDLFRDPDILAKRRGLDPNQEVLVHVKDEKIALPRAEDINNFLFKWLKENRGSNTFCFVWSIETHVPYSAPTEFRKFSRRLELGPKEGERDDIRSAGAEDRQRLINLYDDEIYYNDYCIGQIVNHLKHLQVYDDTLIIITGDHGDAFYEHNVYAHGHAPYDEVIRVPLIMKFPQGRFRGQRVPALVELIDIFPTVVAAAGLDPVQKDNHYVQGHNLLKLLNGYCSTVRGHTFSDTRALEIHNRYLSARNLRWKYIQVQAPKRDGRTFARTLQHVIKRQMILKILRSPLHFLRNYLKGGNEFLFDLESDPEERYNLARQKKEILNQLREVLKDWERGNLDLAEQVGRSHGKYREDEEIRKHLEKLGYM